MAIGGYTTTLLSADQHWSLLATLPASLGIAFVCGLLVGVPALRLSGVYLALATFALAVSVPQFPLKFSKFLGGSNGMHTSETATHLWLYVVGWSCAAISFAAAWLLLRGRIGRAFRAVRDSELAATSSGVSLPIYKTLAFGVSAAFAGVAGSLFVIATNGYVQPGEFGVLLSLQILIGAAVAGPRLALGRPRRSRLHRPPALGRARCPPDRLLPRPGRRLRPDRRPDHAPAPERLRRLPPAF